MFSRSSVKLSRPLMQRAALAARRAGYSSLEEFLEHAIGKELARLEQVDASSAANARAQDALKDDAEEAAKQLKGLGYLE